MVAIALSPTSMPHGSDHPLLRRAQPHDHALDIGGLPRLHLASTSPRRRELLNAAGLAHDAASPGVDDAQLVPGSVDPERWVIALAYLKATSALRTSSEITAPVVVGADTVVVHGGRAFSAPVDAADAARMLRDTRNASHEVLTGVALIDRMTGRRDLFSDRAIVTVGHLSDEQIEQYLASGQWKGKAGAYNLSERLAAGWPITFAGDAGTIMGLPVGKLVERLRTFVARAA